MSAPFTYSYAALIHTSRITVYVLSVIQVGATTIDQKDTLVPSPLPEMSALLHQALLFYCITGASTLFLCKRGFKYCCQVFKGR
jgi:hypothetical protein